MPADDRRDRLIQSLRRVLDATEPVPGHVTAAARAAIETHDLDARLARLLHDSADDERPAGVRGGEPERLLTFEVPPLTVELAVIVDGHVRRLVGQVVDPAPGTVEVRHGDGSTSIAVDDDGRFAATGIPAGPVSLVLQLTSGAMVATEWVTI